MIENGSISNNHGTRHKKNLPLITFTVFIFTQLNFFQAQTNVNSGKGLHRLMEKLKTDVRLIGSPQLFRHNFR